MSCQNPGCMGNYNFNHIAFYARKRYVEGISTIVLLANAMNQCEKEEIALVSLLDVEDDEIRDLQLHLFLAFFHLFFSFFLSYAFFPPILLISPFLFLLL